MSHWHAFAGLMVARLPGVLKCEPPDLPPIFTADRPMPMKIGIDADLLVLFEGANRDELSRWLRWWTGRREYQQALAGGGHRHDLFGDVVLEHEIDEHAAKQAAGRLGWIKKPASKPASSSPTSSSPSASSRPILTLAAAKKPPRVVPRPATKATTGKVQQLRRQISRIVEGQTEDAFIDRLLARTRR